MAFVYSQLSNNFLPSQPLLQTLCTTLTQLQTLKQSNDRCYDWQQQARPEQRLPEGLWRLWLIMAGRGYGKTRTGAETVRQWVMQHGYRRIALIAQTEADARHVMVEGESGLLNIHPNHERPLYESSKRLLRWPNGAVAITYSAEHYDQLRGPQFDAAWIDEFAKFSYPEETWDQLNMALRLGQQPRIVMTTTPRPLPFFKKILAQKHHNTVITRGSTYDNADHLSANYIQFIRDHYEHTAFGRQEIYGDIIDHNPQSLWNQELIQKIQCSHYPPLQRIVIAIDPAVTHHDHSDETGIIVAGRDDHGHAYVIDDLSGKFSCQEWAQRAIAAYHKYQADVIVAEVNMGGDLVQEMLRAIDKTVSYKSVHASRSKMTRAEPVAALYRQHKVFHLNYGLALLEQQLCHYTAESHRHSPDRLDALVWALTELMLVNPKTISQPPQCWSPIDESRS